MFVEGVRRGFAGLILAGGLATASCGEAPNGLESSCDAIPKNSVEKKEKEAGRSLPPISTNKDLLDVLLPVFGPNSIVEAEHAIEKITESRLGVLPVNFFPENIVSELVLTTGVNQVRTDKNQLPIFPDIIFNDGKISFYPGREGIGWTLRGYLSYLNPALEITEDQRQVVGGTLVLPAFSIVNGARKMVTNSADQADRYEDVMGALNLSKKFFPCLDPNSPPSDLGQVLAFIGRQREVSVNEIINTNNSIFNRIRELNVEADYGLNGKTIENIEFLFLLKHLVDARFDYSQFGPLENSYHEGTFSVNFINKIKSSRQETERLIQEMKAQRKNMFTEEWADTGMAIDLLFLIDEVWGLVAVEDPTTVLSADLQLKYNQLGEMAEYFEANNQQILYFLTRQIQIFLETNEGFRITKDQNGTAATKLNEFMEKIFGGKYVVVVDGTSTTHNSNHTPSLP